MGQLAYRIPKGERDNSIPVKAGNERRHLSQWSRKTRVAAAQRVMSLRLWLRLNCLKSSRSRSTARPLATMPENGVSLCPPVRDGGRQLRRERRRVTNTLKRTNGQPKRRYHGRTNGDFTLVRPTYTLSQAWDDLRDASPNAVQARQRSRSSHSSPRTGKPFTRSCSHEHDWSLCIAPVNRSCEQEHGEGEQATSTFRKERYAGCETPKRY